MTKTSISRYLKLTAIEVVAIIFLALSIGIIEIANNNYLFLEKVNERIIPALVGFIPILFFYFIFRIFAKLQFAIALVLIFHFTLIQIGATKQALTTEPLSWTDISSPANISIAWHYIKLWHLVFLLLPIGVGYFAVKLKQIRVPSKKSFIFYIVIIFCLFPFAFYPYVGKINERLGVLLQSRLSDAGIRYYSWDWNHNLKSAGLILHLIQTSRREIPSQPNDLEMKYFSALQERGPEVLVKPKNIIFILCEACWFRGNFFKTEFTPLRSRGFKEFRAISPVYGGGTVNASFELLTGLPAHGALTGIIYQEYADLIKDEAITYPRALKKLGYQTIAAHNHTKFFWRRNIVKPKLGFDDFWGRENMRASDSFFADDEILFERALSELNRGGNPKFLFLTTVYTHGGYEQNNDYGEKDYSTRLSQTVSGMADFIDAALKIEPNTAILIVGDHMPALTKYFSDNSIFPKSVFEKMGDRNEDFKFNPKPLRSIVGDMPAFFYYPNEKKVEKFVNNANKTSFYCMVNFFDQTFVGANLPTLNYLRRNDICSRLEGADYYDVAKSIPDYIFGAVLLK